MNFYLPKFLPEIVPDSFPELLPGTLPESLHESYPELFPSPTWTRTQSGKPSLTRALTWPGKILPDHIPGLTRLPYPTG
jgi:hypothetical protein